jgi:multiple sugar transport system permease protein
MARPSSTVPTAFVDQGVAVASAPVAAGSFTDRHFKYLLVLPAIFFILLIGLFPLVYTLLVSFQNVTMLAEDTSFQGLANYARLLHDVRFWGALGHTFLITAIALPLETILGLLMAQLFLERLPGRQVFIALLIIPTVISPIVAGSMWRLMFDNRFGPVNQILGWLWGEPVTILWTLRPEWVYPAILICEVWQWTPFMFLIFLAALSNVDRSLIEAAQIDGAGYWTIFVRIALPIIKPVLLIALLIRGLDLVRLFDIVWVLTRGGPGTRTETISIYAYVQGFQQFQISYTAAMAFVFILILTAIVFVLLRRMELVR